MTILPLAGELEGVEGWLLQMSAFYDFLFFQQPTPILSTTCIPIEPYFLWRLPVGGLVGYMKKKKHPARSSRFRCSLFLIL